MTRTALRWIRPALVVGLLLQTSALFAQLPTVRLDTVFPPGAQAGTEVEVTVSGGDLDEASRLVFSHDGITSTPKMTEPDDFHPEPRPVENKFLVKVAENVPPGIYEARVVGRFGISNPRAFAVSDAKEVLKEGNPNSPENAMPLELGVIVNGRVGNAQYDYYKVALKKGQEVLIDCYGERIDSKIDATLAVYDPTGRMIRRARLVEGNDPVVNLTAEHDGEYLIQVYDFAYQGGNEYAYRLVVRNEPYIDFVYPPVGQPGSNDEYTLYGRNLPGGEVVEDVRVDGVPLEKVTVKIPLPAEGEGDLPIESVFEPYCTETSATAYRLKGPGGLSNPAFVYYATAPIVLEQDASNDEPAEAQTVEAPCEYVGRFFPRNDRDYVQFQARKGQQFWIHVLAHRLGAPADAAIRIERVTKNDEGEEQVKTIATVDDPNYQNSNNPFDMATRTTDPSYLLKADADATYRIRLTDLYAGSRSDPRLVYRLLIHDAQPDFQLLAFSEPAKQGNNQVPAATVVRKGGAAVVRVQAYRRNGFDGDIEVSVEGLPEGVTCTGATIGGKTESASLVFEAAEDAKSWAGSIRIVGKAKIDGKDVTRNARGAALLWQADNNNPGGTRLVRSLGLAVVDAETAPASLQIGEGKLLETARGGKLELPVKVSKHAELKGDVKVSAVGLHKDMQPKDVNVKGDDGKIELEVKSDNVPTGVYTFHFVGTSKFNYKRNEDAVKRAQAEQKRAEELVKKFQEAEKQAKSKQAEAKKAADEAASALKSAQDEAQKADQQVQSATKTVQDAEKKAKDAAAAVAEAEKKLEAAKQAAAKDESKKDQVPPAEKAVADAKSASEQATKELDEAKKKLAEAEKAAADAKKAVAEAEKKEAEAKQAQQKAEQAAKAAEDKRQAAENFKKQTDNELKNEQNRNKAKDVNIEIVSSPVRVRVVDHPLNVDVASPGKLKQGEKAKVKVSLEKLFGFDDNVNVDFQAPGSLKGVSASNLQIKKGQNEGEFELTANDNATPGKHTAEIRVRYKFGNVNHETRHSFDFEIEEVEKKDEKKK